MRVDYCLAGSAGPGEALVAGAAQWTQQVGDPLLTNLNRAAVLNSNLFTITNTNFLLSHPITDLNLNLQPTSLMLILSCGLGSRGVHQPQQCSSQ